METLNPIKVYTIRTLFGEYVGTEKGVSKREALEDVAYRMGYVSFIALCLLTGRCPVDFVVTEEAV